MVQCDEIGQYLEVIGNKCSQVLGILGYLKNIVLKCDYFFATFFINGLLFIASSGHTAHDEALRKLITSKSFKLFLTLIRSKNNFVNF